jgi:heme/copper-type cytochrome/quinol oxidase subunit 2
MRFWLPQATTSAAEVDYLILALLLTSCAILALVFGLILLYMIKYRAGSDIDRGVLAEKTWRLEAAWTVATLLIFFGLFVWGADLYVRLFQPPSDALKIYVIGKQWMWKIEHQGGQRETLGNFLVSLMLGARDLAFPRLNLLSWYLFVAAGLVVLYALFVGGVDTGWTFYTPLASTYSRSHVVAAVAGVFIAGFSSIAPGLNFIVTIHRLRAPGMTRYKMPVFLWSLYATSVLFVLATPVLAMTLLLLSFERIFHIGVFDPALGGDPLLFQHLFWFYSHPAVYIMVLPSLGVISEIVPALLEQAAIRL